jgi:hypothetical protein
LATGCFGGGDDGLEVEDAVADFAKVWLVLGGGEVILEVDDRKAAGELFAPGDVVAAAVLDPVGVGFSLERRCGGAVIDKVENDLSVEFLELAVMIVITEDLAGLVEDFSGVLEFRDQVVEALAAGEIEVVRVGIGSDLAVEGAEVIDDFLRRIEDVGAGFVGGGAGHAGIGKDAAEFLVGDGAEAAGLHGGVTNFAETGEGLCDAGGVGEGVAAGIELSGYLGDFHGKLVG